MVAEKESKKRYAVEWYSQVPKDKNGDSDWDRATCEVREFPSMGLAVAFARRVVREKRNAGGDVQIDVEHFVPSGMDRGWYPWAKYNFADDGRYERVG